MFKEYSPIDDKMFRVMDNDGKIINKKYFAGLSDKEIVDAYKDMLFERTADLMIVSYQRQGRIYTYPPSSGQEAIHIAAANVIEKQDWLVPAFRELGTYLAKGATLKEIFLYYMGYEDGAVFKDAENTMPLSVPIASQLLHATGIGFALNYQKKKDAVFAFVGDGGTSEGDFHEALNFAGVWNTPVVFVVQNNQFAISTYKKDQTASVNYAVKALAYGIEGIKVDGNDYFAMKAALKHAKEHCAAGKGPVLIEAVTFRKGAHTTSDDPKKYRTQEMETKWEKTDPLDRLKKYIDDNKLMEGFDEEKVVKDYKKEIDRIFIEAENHPKYPLSDVFDYLYADKPDLLKKQQMRHEKFLKWQEQQK